MTLVIPRRAFTRIICERDVSYVDDMYVEPRYRRKGYCSQLLRFAIGYLSVFPELDVRHQSSILQRVAKNLGYVKVGPSQRYDGCERWIHGANEKKLPTTSLKLTHRRRYASRTGSTQVLYLRLPTDILPQD